MSGSSTPPGAPGTSAPFADDRPLFIVGCVRSGTTLTRDLLRRVPNFICPEETHFYRWAEPFRTPTSMAPYRNNALLERHRTLDGVDEDVFEHLLTHSRGKAEFQRNYITAYATALGVTGPYRWFDKTPQNVYGAALIAHQMPNARFLNMVRNPLNVVASMKLGRQVKVPDIHGACNYWNEAVHIMATIRAAYPRRVLVMRYEDLVADVPAQVSRILSFADVAEPAGLFSKRDAHAEANLWRDALTKADVQVIRNRCGVLAKEFGYDLSAIYDAL